MAGCLVLGVELREGLLLVEFVDASDDDLLLHDDMRLFVFDEIQRDFLFFEDHKAEASCLSGFPVFDNIGFVDFSEL